MQPAATYSSTLGHLSKEAIKVLLYFDMFHYPLSLEEIRNNFPHNGFSDDELRGALSALRSQGLIEVKNGLYYVGDAEDVARRIKGNKLASRTVTKAERFFRIIASFPFVRGVMISGSLSKGYMDKDTDVDYFIVTKPGRLWLSRSLLVFFKKVVLLNSRKYFCVNYFVDENSLEIEDKNMFTAKEVKYLIPVYGEKVFAEFLESNAWVKDYLPNKDHFSKSSYQKPFTPRLKKVTEWMFGGWIGQKLDDFFLWLTETFWRRKHREKHSINDDVSIRCHKHVSKYHPSNFQERVFERMEVQLRTFEKEKGVSLR